MGHGVGVSGCIYPLTIATGHVHDGNHSHSGIQRSHFHIRCCKYKVQRDDLFTPCREDLEAHSGTVRFPREKVGLELIMTFKRIDGMTRG